MFSARMSAIDGVEDESDTRRGRPRVLAAAGFVAGFRRNEEVAVGAFAGEVRLGQGTQGVPCACLEMDSEASRCACASVCVAHSEACGCVAGADHRFVREVGATLASVEHDGVASLEGQPTVLPCSLGAVVSGEKGVDSGPVSRGVASARRAHALANVSVRDAELEVRACGLNASRARGEVGRAVARRERHVLASLRVPLADRRAAALKKYDARVVARKAERVKRVETCEAARRAEQRRAVACQLLAAVASREVRVTEQRRTVAAEREVCLALGQRSSCSGGCGCSSCNSSRLGGSGSCHSRGVTGSCTSGEGCGCCHCCVLPGVSGTQCSEIDAGGSHGQAVEVAGYPVWAAV
jgi:hypothetical protein